MNTTYANSIEAIEAVELTKGYRIEAVLKSGERQVIKKKSNKKPKAVQLHSARVNGNASDYNHPSAYFRFAVKVDSWDADTHLQGFAVQ